MPVPSIEEIFQIIIDEKNTKASLVGLLPTVDNLPLLLQDIGNSPSDAAIWRQWAFIIASCQQTIYQKFEDNKAEVAALIANQQPMPIRWYQEQAFNFQYGDPLVWKEVANIYGQVHSRYSYDIIDPAKQIVNRCAAIVIGNQILIKTAIESGGILRKLTAPELTALIAYYDKITGPGVTLTVISFDADVVKLAYDIYFNGLVDLPTLKANVEAAIQKYFAQLSGLELAEFFNGTLNLNKLNDALQAVTGVVDPRKISVQTKSGANPFVEVVGQAQLESGYCIIDPISLYTGINYIPYAI